MFGAIGTGNLFDLCNILNEERIIEIFHALSRQLSDRTAHREGGGAFEDAFQRFGFLGIHSERTVTDRRVAVKKIKREIKFCPITRGFHGEVQNLAQQHEIPLRVVNKCDRSRLDLKRFAIDEFRV